MPNWAGANSRAVEARQKKAVVALEKKRAEEQRKEAEQWKDDVTEAKFEKKEKLLTHLQEKSEKKAELRKLAAEEDAKLAGSNKKNTKQNPKLTRAEIQQRALLTSLTANKAEPEDKGRYNKQELPLENLNKAVLKQQRQAASEGVGFVSASSVAQFIESYSDPQLGGDKWPKVTYAAYENEWLDKLKVQNPTLKRSQLKEKVWKQWQKAPENPINQVAKYPQLGR